MRTHKLVMRAIGVSHTAFKDVSTKYSISQLACIFIFYNNIEIHSGYEMIKDLVDTDVRNIACDPPIARIYHICTGLLYARCGV